MITKKAVTTEQLVDLLHSFTHCMKNSISVNGTMGELSFVQIRVLIFLKHNPDASMSALAKELQIELPSVTSLIDRLIKHELVMRKTDPTDRRLVLVALTETGEQLLKEAMKLRLATYTTMLSKLSDQDKQDLLRILTNLMESMKK